MTDRPRPDRSDVDLASPAVMPEVADTLAAAFADDPIWQWLVPSARRRPAAFGATFRGLVDLVYARHERIWTTDRLDAVACWLPPGRATIPPAAEARLLPAVARGGARSLVRTLRIDRALGAVHPEAPHWYLGYIGVRPEARGRGWGGQLLAASLAHVDAENMPAYLEASTPRSRELYLRHGFEDLGAPVRVGSSPPLFPMWRPARTARAAAV